MYFILNDVLVTAPSLETVSELSPASLAPPMMTSWSPWDQALEPYLPSESLRGSIVHPPVCLFHLRQLLRVDESNPPQSSWPDWTCPTLLSGSEGSLHEVLVQGRNTSADCSAPNPPVMRMAAEMEIFIFSEYIHIIFQNVKKQAPPGHGSD